MTDKNLYILTTDENYRLYFPFNSILIRELGKIPSAKFEELLSCWTISIKDSLFVNSFADFAVSKNLVTDVRWITSEEETKMHSDRMPDLEGDCSFLMRPYDYQRKGIRYMIENKRTFNGDDMGLGKTLQSIMAVCLAKAFPCLVVCPACMKMTWQREFKKITGRNATLLTNENRNDWQTLFIKGESSVFIVNYESLKKFFVAGIRGSKTTVKNIVLDERVSIFRSVVVDECHRCKESSTQWSKHLEAICQGKEYVFMLTGTPIVTSIKDLKQQLKIMGRLEDFGGSRKFTARYCHNDLTPELMSELNARLWDKCYFRRDKSMVLKELPEKIRQYHIIHLDNDAEYRKAENDLISYLQSMQECDESKIRKAMMSQAIVKIGVLRRLCGQGKLRESINLIGDILATGKKVIVFTAHKAMVKAFKKQFKGSVSVTGEDTSESKQKAVDKFQNDPDCRLIVLNIKSGGVGITLTAASHVVFAELPWTAADCDQCECRAHRNGQKEVVTCTYLVGENTFDETMWNIIDKERKQAGIVTGAKNDINEIIVNASMKRYNL